MRTLFLFLIITIQISGLSCQKRSPEDQTMKKAIAQDSIKIDSTKTNARERSYPPEPDGYKGIHQQEKEKYNKKNSTKLQPALFL